MVCSKIGEKIRRIFCEYGAAVGAAIGAVVGSIGGSYLADNTLSSDSEDEDD